MVDHLEQTRTPENRAHTLTIPKRGVQQIAAGTLAGIDRGQRTIVSGRQAKLLVSAQRIVPAVAELIARRRIKAVYVGPTRSDWPPSAGQ
ncbi:hypothetical protein [Nocardia sp. CA-120079]|uniref:hypothetical protein n=1 Tax=Nocardia sp. CA-120079 TaxID=3239974 RepID=UPI003D9783AB